MAELACPYNCKDGYIINLYTHSKTLCPSCAGKRRKEVKEDVTVYERLSLPKNITGSVFRPELFVPEAANGVIKESRDVFLNEMRGIMDGVAAGNPPETSLLLAPGANAVVAAFIVPYLLKAYASEVSVSPLLTGADIIAKRNNLDKENDKSFYNDVDTEVCLIFLDGGTTAAEVSAAKGLMQLRGFKGHSTVILASVWNKRLFELMSYGENDKTLARLISVEYEGREVRHNSIRPEGGLKFGDLK